MEEIRQQLATAREAFLKAERDCTRVNSPLMNLLRKRAYRAWIETVRRFNTYGETQSETA